MRTLRSVRKHLPLVGLVSGSLGALIVVPAIVITTRTGQFDFQIEFLFVTYFILGLCACQAVILKRGRMMSRFVAVLGAIAATWGLLDMLVISGADEMTAYPFFATAFLAYTAALLALEPAGRVLKYARHVGVLCAAIFSSMMVIWLYHNIEREWLEWTARVSVGVVAGLALFLPAWSAWLNQRRVEALQSAAATIDLACPRCGERQCLELGRQRCRACRLVITLDVEEPLCPGCGFVLFRLTGDHCPECGRAIPTLEREGAID